jgi:hypothetical protein
MYNQIKVTDINTSAIIIINIDMVACIKHAKSNKRILFSLAHCGNRTILITSLKKEFGIAYPFLADEEILVSDEDYAKVLLKLELK